MRLQLAVLATVAAVALSAAPAHASVCKLADPDCNALLPGYWQDPTSPSCPLVGCDWLIIH